MNLTNGCHFIDMKCESHSLMNLHSGKIICQMLYIKHIKCPGYGIVHLLHTQNFLENLHFLPPDTHTRSYEYKRVRNISFSENFVCVLNE